MMGDMLIRASEARRAILNVDPKLAYCIDSVPAAMRWIPVRERLPDKDGNYLVYQTSPFADWCEVVGFAKDGRKVDEYTFRRNWKNVWLRYDSEYGYLAIDSVTHWMPLPQPPKED